MLSIQRCYSKCVTKPTFFKRFYPERGRFCQMYNMNMCMFSMFPSGNFFFRNKTLRAVESILGLATKANGVFLINE